MRPPRGKKVTQIVVSFEGGTIRRLSGDDAHRWMSKISGILVWLSPIKADAHSDNFAWEESVGLAGNNVAKLKLDAVRRIVFLHGKENRDSVVYREAVEELERLGLDPG